MSPKDVSLKTQNYFLSLLTANYRQSEETLREFLEFFLQAKDDSCLLFTNRFVS